MKFFITSTILALLSVSRKVHGDPMDTCDKQQNCIKVTAVKTEGGAACDGDCDYTICLKLVLGDGSTDGCVKSKSDTVSHTCQRDSGICLDGTNPDGTPTCIFKDADELLQRADGYEQCQTVPPGGTAYFLLKDGSGCSGEGTVSVGGGFGVTAACAPSVATSDSACENAKAVDSCTGNKPGVECIWTVTAPSDCGAEPTCVPNQGNCCPPKDPCSTELCSGIECPEPGWKCKLVCEQEQEDYTCLPVAQPTRRNLKEAVDDAVSQAKKGYLRL